MKEKTEIDELLGDLKPILRIQKLMYTQYKIRNIIFDSTRDNITLDAIISQTERFIEGIDFGHKAFEIAKRYKKSPEKIITEMMWNLRYLNSEYQAQILNYFMPIYNFVYQISKSDSFLVDSVQMGEETLSDLGQNIIYLVEAFVADDVAENFYAIGGNERIHYNELIELLYKGIYGIEKLKLKNSGDIIEFREKQLAMMEHINLDELDELIWRFNEKWNGIELNTEFYDVPLNEFFTPNHSILYGEGQTIEDIDNNNLKLLDQFSINIYFHDESEKVVGQMTKQLLHEHRQGVNISVVQDLNSQHHPYFSIHNQRDIIKIQHYIRRGEFYTLSMEVPRKYENRYKERIFFKMDMREESPYQGSLLFTNYFDSIHLIPKQLRRLAPLFSKR